MVGVLEADDPGGGGGGQDAVAGVAGGDPQSGGEVVLSGAEWAEEDDVRGLGQLVPAGQGADDRQVRLPTVRTRRGEPVLPARLFPL